jgi:hypothetical protein
LFIRPVASTASIFVLAALALGACGAQRSATGSASPAAVPSPRDTPIAGDTSPIPDEATAAACGADRAARYIGRQATPALRAEVGALVGDRRIRWIAPGDAVTMDFSPSRLNMMLDERATITEARCG